MFPWVKVAEFVPVNSGSGHRVGMKAAHSGINVRWMPSHIPETQPQPMVDTEVQIAGQYIQEFSTEVQVKIGIECS